MLCDDLCNSEKIRMVYPSMCGILDRIAASPKFILDRNYAQSTDQLSDDMPQLFRLGAFCRPPYGECWFEVSHSDRNSFTRLPVLDGQAAPSRIGWFIHEHDAPKWKAHLFWSFKGAINELAMSHWAVTYNPNPDSIADIGDFVRADWFEELPQRTQSLITSVESKDDWLGEHHFIMAILALLNTRNVSDIIHAEIGEKKNLRRLSAGRAPLFSYNLLKIQQRLLTQRNIATDERGADAQIRAHFVRGHFKIRKTGVFFWSPFVRGDLKHGFARKDYQLAS